MRGLRRCHVGSLRRFLVWALPPVLCVALAGPVAARAGGGAPAERLVAPVSGEFHFEGRGYGHGRGMSQWGAEGAASHGVDYRTILATYYPGTELAAEDGPVPPLRVLLTGIGRDGLQVAATPGLRLITGDRSTRLPRRIDGVSVTGWRVRSAEDGWRLDASADGWHRYPVRAAAGAPVELAATTPLRIVLRDEQREYRGALRVLPADGSGQVRVVNVVDMEDYLRSVVPDESPAEWAPAALQAQAVAARTYASWHVVHAAPDAVSDICDSTTCQVYRGVRRLHGNGQEERTWEDPRSDRAVRATQGEELLYRGQPALAEFSDSNGGWSTAGGEPYLPARPDPWDGLVPNHSHSWTRTVSAARIEQIWPRIGRPTGLAAARRDGDGVWGGRVLSVRIVGERGEVVVPGPKFAHETGMLNWWWQVEPDPGTVNGELPQAPPASPPPTADPEPSATPQPSTDAQPAAPGRPEDPPRSPAAPTAAPTPAGSSTGPMAAATADKARGTDSPEGSAAAGRQPGH
jgi:SpoIID/LytB domain protein